MTSAATATDPIIARHDRYMTLNYPRYPIAMVRGEGCRVWDSQGHEYLDLFAGFGAPLLGHCHPDLIEAVTEQARKLWHVGNLFHTEPQTHLAERIARHGFGGRSFFCHSGADANEAAIKLARLYGKAHPGPNPGEHGQRIKIISATRSFHGRSFGTMPATGNPVVREGFGPMPPGFVNVPYNDLAAIEAELDGSAVAVLVEPIQGEGGINVPNTDYFPQLRKLCDRHDLLLICDEVWTGCGRTGRYFGHQLWGIEPDIMTLGKGVGGGLAVGTMCVGPRAAELYDARKQGAVKHATTLGGNCLAMAVATRIFDVLERDGLVQQAARLGEHALNRLQTFAQQCPMIKQVRGRGLFLGIDLDFNHAPAGRKSISEIVNACIEQRLLVNGTQNTVLRIAPALVISPDQLDEGLSRIEAVLNGQT